MTEVVTDRPGLRSRTLAARTAVRPQLVLVAAQVVAGIGNLVFALIAVRLLEPGSYARLAAFLAATLLVQLPTATLSAVGALDPERSRATRRSWMRLSVGVAVLVAVLSPLVADALDAHVGGVIAIAALLPGLAALGVDRGVLYGLERHRDLTRSLIVEPAVRVGAGTILTIMFGLPGAVIGVVLATYVALAMTATGADLDHVERPRPPTAVMTVAPAAFLLLALLQTQDLFVANAHLDGIDAARFAMLSTLGGAAVFATATVPLVLMPQLARGRSSASTTALVLTAATGVAITVGGALMAGLLVRSAFGGEYAAAAGLLAPYLLAMTFLSIGRVLVARRCLRRPVGVVVACGVVAAGHLLALLAFGRSPTSVVVTSLVAMAGLVVVLVAPDVLAMPAVRRRSEALVDRVTSPVAVRLAVLGTVALGLRLVMFRGLWVDEAISVQQARMPLGAMLHELATTDVHPPLHHLILWGTVRIFGTSELVVRLPSMLAGVSLVPLLFLAGSLLFDRRTGWVAAILAVPAPLLVWYSQEARMYALFMVLAISALCAQVLAIRVGRTIHWMTYSVTTAALVWTQYFGVLPFFVQQCAFLAVMWERRHDRHERRRLLAGWSSSLAVIALLLLPLLPYAHEQLSGSAGGWLRSPGDIGSVGSTALAGTASAHVSSHVSIYGVVANSIWAVLGYHSQGTMVAIAALWPLGMLAALMLVGRGWSRSSSLLLGIAVAPMAALAFANTMKPGVFELRYASASVPAALLLGARFITATARRRVLLAAATTLVVTTMVVALVDEQVNTTNPRRYDFADALQRIRREAEPADLIVYDPVYLEDVIAYYAPDVGAQPIQHGVDSIRADRGVWVLAATNLEDANVLGSRVGTALVKLEGTRRLHDHFRQSNIEVWELR